MLSLCIREGSNMTTLGDAKTQASATSSATFDVRAELQVSQSGGFKANDHAGLWLTNLGTAAGDVIWFRLDNIPAISGGDDCYPLRPGERCYVRKTDFISYIAA